VIVASGALEYVPFAALPLPETEGQRDKETRRQGDKETGRRGKSPLPAPHSPFPIPLIASHEAVNLPSASALALIRREADGRQAAPKILAALADPVCDANDPRLAGAKQQACPKNSIAFAESAESPSVSSLLPPELARSVRSFHRNGFDRLVFSNDEAEFVTGFAPRSLTLKATGFKANHQLAVSGELSRYRIIHFATH